MMWPFKKKSKIVRPTAEESVVDSNFPEFTNALKADRVVPGVTRPGALSASEVLATLPASPTFKTKTGRVLTDKDFEALADEAEAGYDVEHLISHDPLTLAVNRAFNTGEHVYWQEGDPLPDPAGPVKPLKRSWELWDSASGNMISCTEDPQEMEVWEAEYRNDPDVKIIPYL